MARPYARLRRGGRRGKAVAAASQLLLQIGDRLRKIGQRGPARYPAAAEAPASLANENIRWRLTDGGNIRLSVTDMSGEEFSIIVTVSDVWELFISFFGTTAAALAQGGLERKRASCIEAGGVEVAGGKETDGLVVTFGDGLGGQTSIRLNRAAASELRHELALRLERTRHGVAGRARPRRTGRAEAGA